MNTPKINENWNLFQTGSSFTKTFDIRCYFYIGEKRKVKVCPVHMKIVKGCRNERYVYQLVPKEHAVIRIYGSINPRGEGLTPDEYLRRGAVEFLEIHGRPKLFIESAEKGIIKEVFEDMCNAVPGRFCYSPPAAEDWSVVEVRFGGIEEFIEFVNKSYESYRPSWFEGGYLKAGTITPCMQGNLIGSSKLPAPLWVMSEAPTISRVSEVCIKGNEKNEHKIEFDSEVEVIMRDNAALVHSNKTVSFEIIHPQHDNIAGKFTGLIQFVHLRVREF